jgi:hypothetical protein
MPKRWELNDKWQVWYGNRWLGVDGIQRRLEKNSTWQKEYRAANRHNISAKRREQYRKNKEKGDIPKTWELNDKWQVYFNGYWRNINSKTEDYIIEWKRKAKIHEKKNRYSESRKRADRKYYQKNKEKINARGKRWAANNKELCRVYADRKYRKQTPTYGLKRAISEYRRGRITLDDLTRRCEDACIRADVLCREVNPGTGQPTSNLERTSECSQGNSGIGKSKG